LSDRLGGSRGTSAVALAVLFLLLVPAKALAQRRKALDYGLAATSTALIVTDWRQTLAFRARGDREWNPILGPYPSEGRVNTIIGLGLLANAGALLLPKTPRRVWYVTMILLEGYAAIRNATIYHRAAGTAPLGPLGVFRVTTFF
jgi:hypothetical protein